MENPRNKKVCWDILPGIFILIKYFGKPFRAYFRFKKGSFGPKAVRIGVNIIGERHTVWDHKRMYKRVFHTVSLMEIMTADNH
jgi:hypothetical protein